MRRAVSWRRAGKSCLLRRTMEVSGRRRCDRSSITQQPEAILEKLSEDWIQYGHTTLRLLEKTSRHRVRLFSDLDPELVRSLGFEPVADLAAVVDEWRTEHPGTRVGVMPGAAGVPGFAGRY